MSRPKIEARSERRRGCGYRQPGGMYLVAGGVAAPCGKLPLPLSVCQYCGSGFKPARGWTWIKPGPLVEDRPCDNKKGCFTCPLGVSPPKRAGLIWVGAQHYRTPQQFTREAVSMGISRRLNQIPRGLVIGETWVLLAHRRSNFVSKNGCDDGTPEALPAIFSAFLPTGLEYVVRAEDTAEDLNRLVERGFTLIEVTRLGEETEELFPTSEETEEDVDDESFPTSDETEVDLEATDREADELYDERDD